MVLNLLSKLDFLSPSPTLLIYSKSRFQTAFGGLFSILCGMSIVVISLYFIITTFSRDEKYIMYNEIESDNPNYDFFTFPHGFTITNGNGDQVKDPDRYFNFQPLFGEMNLTNSRLDWYFPIIDKNCASNYETYWPQYKSAINLNNVSFSCINFTTPDMIDKKIKGKYGDVLGGFSLLSLHINKCVNISQLGKSDCYPQEKIDNLLKSAYFQFMFIDYMIDNNNQTTAGIPFIKNNPISISSTINKRMWAKFRNVEYNTDVGYVFTDIHTQEFNKLEAITETYNLNFEGIFPGDFAEFTIINSNIKEIHFRSFTKLQNLLANIGGVMKGVMFLSIMIENYLVKTLYILHLANEFVHIKDNKHDKNKKFISCVKLRNNFKNNLNTITTPTSVLREGSYSKENSVSISAINGLNTITGKPNPSHKKSIKIQKLNISCKEFICLKLHKTKKLRILEAVEKYMNKKTSIDYFLKKFIEFDKLKFILMNQHEINAMKLINLPSLNLVMYDVKDNEVQKLWAYNEFDNGVNKISIEKLSQDFNKENLSITERKILNLIEGKCLQINENSEKHINDRSLNVISL